MMELSWLCGPPVSSFLSSDKAFFLTSSGIFDFSIRSRYPASPEEPSLSPSSSWIALSCSRSIASRFDLFTLSETFLAISIRILIFSFVFMRISRNVIYRCRTDTISRSACFSASFTGINGMINPMIWSMESILSMGRIKCSEPWKRLLISCRVFFMSARSMACISSSRSASSTTGSTVAENHPFFSKRVTAFTLRTACAQTRYPSSAGCTCEIRNRFPVL